MKVAIIAGIIWGVVITGLVALWPWMAELGTPLPPNYRPVVVGKNATALAAQPKVKGHPQPGLEQRLFKMINDYRRAKKLRPLDSDTRFATIARTYTVDMLERGFFGPDNPDGLSLRDLVARSDRRFIGPVWALVSNVPPFELPGGAPSEEQIAKEIWKQWEGSPATLNGLTNRQMNEAGVGAAKAGKAGRVCLLMAYPMARLSQDLPLTLHQGTEVTLSLTPRAGGPQVQFISLWNMDKGLEALAPQRWPRLRLNLPSGRYRTMFYFAAKGKQGTEGHYGPELNVTLP